MVGAHRPCRLAWYFVSGRAPARPDFESLRTGQGNPRSAPGGETGKKAQARPKNGPRVAWTAGSGGVQGMIRAGGMTVPVTVSQLAIAPVKGMRLHGASEIRLGRYGVIGDREFMVIGEDGS